METTVRDNPEESRYEIRDGDRVLGLAAYERRGDTTVFIHTEVDPDAGQDGLGSTLVRAALDDVRGRLRPQHGQDAVVVDLEDHRRERLARARADTAVAVDLDPAHRAPVSRAGSRLIPLTNDERSRSGSPVTSRSGSRSNSVRNVTAISRRAR